jgi:hypothetical protein
MPPERARNLYDVPHRERLNDARTPVVFEFLYIHATNVLVIFSGNFNG